MKGNKFHFLSGVLGGFVLIFLSGCSVFRATAHYYNWKTYQVKNTEINASILPDSAVTAYLAPYKKRVDGVMDKVVGYSEGDFNKGKPDGTLGNLVADAIRIAAGNLIGKSVDIGVITNSSIKSHIKMGTITAGMVYNLMPYNNHLVILKISGSQVDSLAEQIAKVGGEPVSGLRMSIVDNQAQAILVGDHVVNRDSLYTVATNDYIANGGGDLSVLWHPLKRRDLSLTIRKAITDYIEDRIKIHPVNDGRIR